MYIATLPLTADASGVRLRVRAVPGARREGVVGRHGDALRIAVRAVAEKGRANEALIRVVAELFAVPRRAVEIASGGGTREKTIAIAGIDLDAARAVLERLDGASAAGGASAAAPPVRGPSVRRGAA